MAEERVPVLLKQFPVSVRQRLHAQAILEGRSMTAVVVDAVEAYLKQFGKDTSEPGPEGRRPRKG